MHDSRSGYLTLNNNTLLQNVEIKNLVVECFQVLNILKFQYCVTVDI